MTKATRFREYTADQLYLCCSEYKPHTSYQLQWTYETSTFYHICGIESNSFNLSSTSRPPEEIWHKATWGEARKTLSLSPVSAVWEKSIEVSKLDSSIFYCVNLISSHGERKMGGWFEGKRWESFRCRCTRGEKEVINGEVKELFIYTKFLMHSHRLQ